MIPPDPRSPADFTGRRLLGTFLVGERIAEGGMGAIYRAVDTNLGRPVAVKVPHPRFLAEPGFRARLAAETEDLVRLEHPHVVRILARGEEDGVPFLVLQWLGGGSLEDRRDRAGGRLPPASVAEWLPAIAGTLDFVHARGIVHRDVKPGNVLFDEEGHVFLSDFGVARGLVARSDTTAPGVAIGSPRYMAPEQGLGAPVGPAADQYALASTVYEALAGTSPFGDGGPVEVLVRKTREDPRPLREAAPDVPPGAAAAVTRALSRDPAARFPTCRAFAEAFGAALLPSPPSPAPVSQPEESPGSPALPRPTTGAPDLPPAGGTRPARRAVLLLPVAGLVLLGLALLVLRGHEPRPPTPPGTEEVPYELLLVDPGAEPREVLRYRLAPGSRERLVLFNQARQAFRRGASPERVFEAGPWRMEADLSVDTVEPGAGPIRFRWVTTDAGLDAAGPGQPEPQVVREATRAFVGLGVTGTADDRGRVLSARAEGVDPAETLQRSLLEAQQLGLQSLLTPLPAEAIGVGAVWQVTEPRVDVMGIRAVATTTYRLRSREGYVLRLEVEGALTAPSQPLAMPVGLGPAEAHLESFHGRIHGESRLDVTQFVPRDMEVTSHGEIGLLLTGGEAAGFTRMTFATRTEMRRR